MNVKEIKLFDIAKILNGNLVGNENHSICEISEPFYYNKQSLIFVKNPKKWIQSTSVNSENLPGCIILEKNALGNYKGNQILVENYDTAFIKILSFFGEKESKEPKISNLANIKSQNISTNVIIEDFVTIDTNSRVDDDTYIGHGTYIGKNVSIGKNVVIEANCVIYNNTIIENNVIIHSGVIIGNDGFGYAEIDGKHVKIPQIGNVIIKDNVEVGANTCIDRATIGSTIIGANTKIDNLCQIAHNVKIGENCIIISQVGISGSTQIGNNCILAGQVGIADHVTLESGTIVGAQSGITRSSRKQSKHLLGSPARDMMKEKKIIAFLNKSSEILDRIRKLERKSN